MNTFAMQLKSAALLWYDRDADSMAATVSYYALFALAPLLLLTVSLVGLVIGPELIRGELLRWGSVLGPDVLQLLTRAVDNLGALSVGVGIPLFGALFFSGMVVVMCNTFTSGLHRLWGIPHQGIRGWLRKTRNSIVFLLVLEVYLLAVIAVSIISSNYTDGAWLPLVSILKNLFFIIVTTILFSLMYHLLPWSSPGLRARLTGALIASGLFVVAKVLVASYITVTPVPGLYGAAGLILVLLIWLYATTCIIYFGAAVAKTLEA